jgi:pterin-4a-carbinolamine dehydratase
MPSQSPKCVFISYRRRDSSIFARWLSEALTQNFGQEQVFLDTTVIRSGVKWPTDIARALKKSAVLIAIIGPEWLRAHDKFHKRRIDDTNDWVRNEILYALQHKIPIIPLLVMNAELPDPEALPTPLRALRDYQVFVFRENEHETDLGNLLSRVEDFGFKRSTPQVQYPNPAPSKRDDKLTDQELKKVIGRLSNWKVVTNRISPAGKRKTELMRTYEFTTFDEAIHFMATAARHITMVDHHPDWENIWKTITVWLTTWDAGHHPSVHDIELAEYLDQLYSDYQTKERIPKKPMSKTPKRSVRR